MTEVDHSSSKQNEYMNNPGSGQQPDALKQRQTMISMPPCSTLHDNQDAAGDGEGISGEDEPPSGPRPAGVEHSRRDSTPPY